MGATIKNAWKNHEIRTKMLFTLLILLLFRLGSAIPVPFISTSTLQMYFQAMDNTALGLLNTISGGAFASATVFALGVQPYINASIIVQLLCVAIPALENMAKEEGEIGRKKIERITMYVAIGLGLLQAYGYYVLISRNGLLQESAVGVWWKAAIIILAFAAGSVAIMFMGKAIDKKGVGNGISMILFAGIISRLPHSIISTAANIVSGNLAWWIALLTYLGVLALIVLIVYVNDAERRIPIQYATRTLGRKTYSAHSSFLPMRVNMGGVMPIIFAQTIVTVPATIAAFIGKTNSWWAQTNNILYIIVYALLIIGFAYFYASITFDCFEVSNTLKKNGGTIPGYRPGKPTTEVLVGVLKRITLIGAVYLGIVAVIPMIISHFVPAVSLTGLSLGGTTIIIAVGVALDTFRDVEMKLQVRNYSGLFAEQNGRIR